MATTPISNKLNPVAVWNAAKPWGTNDSTVSKIAKFILFPISGIGATVWAVIAFVHNYVKDMFQSKAVTLTKWQEVWNWTTSHLTSAKEKTFAAGKKISDYVMDHKKTFFMGISAIAIATAGGIYRNELSGCGSWLINKIWASSETPSEVPEASENTVTESN